MKKKTDLVVKSKKLVEASYRLSLVEQQLILFTIVQARENQTGLFPDQPCVIRVTDFARAFGVDTEKNKGLYDELKNAVNNLYDRSLTFTESYINDAGRVTGFKRVTETRWISEKSYVDGAGLLHMIFAPAVIPEITRLEERFTTYFLQKMSKLTSVYAIRLYELMTSFKEIGKREIKLDWLRMHFDLGDSYSKVAELKRNVIDPSVKQINKHTDLKISYTQTKTGRNVTGFVFTIRPNVPKAATKKTVSADPVVDDVEF